MNSDDSALVATITEQALPLNGTDRDFDAVIEAAPARAPSRPALPRASRATVAPWRANSTAVARPTPAEAPVTTTILLASSDMEDLHRLVGIIR